MRWRGRRTSSNVVNRRGGGGGSPLPIWLIFVVVRLIFTRFGFLGIVVLVGGYFLLSAVGLDPLRMLAEPGASVGSTARAPVTDNICEEGSQTDRFVCVVLASTEDVWNAQFAANGRDYPEPQLVIFSGSVDAGGCGYASAAVGPFYCPATDSLYLDTSFFDQLASRFGAPGDFAQAYVIAHEVGHHIQNVTGLLNEADRARSISEAEGRAMQVRIELQADCFAGVWAYHENQLAGLEEGDIAEALRAASAVGDDTLARQAGRRPVPDSFTHGSAAQRQEWFSRGWRSGRMEDCDTFRASL